MKLHQRIENKDTELHRAYWKAMDKKRQIESHLSELDRRISELNEELAELNTTIETCKHRAAEQAYPDLFED